jgi:putative transposase
VAERATQLGCRKAQINPLLRQYWQDGCVPNATLPNFHRCGQTKNRKDNGKKRGRPCAGGRNLTSEDKDKFRRGIKEFKQTGIAKTLRDVWDRTKEKYFNIGYTELPDRTLVPILPPPDGIPSFDQFKSFYYKELNRKKEIIGTDGEAAYESDNRPIIGDETLKAFGPGALYEIDPTVGDIYLRCYLIRKRIIGRPVIYIVVDVFSRLIVGFAVTLEGPSWAGAKLALENAFSDKVAFCKQFGIEITEADWPVQGKCEALLGDNGEIAGYNANSLVDPLGIRVVNAPTDRPDLKGIVEGRFPIINRIAIKWVPGAVRSLRKRRGKDYRLDATLDLNQFRKLMILCILYYNNSRRLEDYRMSKHMIADEVKPIPLEMWNWGMQKLTGKLRPEDPEVLSKNLLPRGKASVTPQGIRFRGVHYVCERAVKEQWFERIKGKRTKQVEIVHESLVDHIYLRLERGKRFEPCELTPADERFKGCDWYDLLEYFALKKQAAKASQADLQQEAARFHAQADELISQATEMNNAAMDNDDRSARAQIRGIKAHRRALKAHERKHGMSRPSPANTSNEPAKVIPIKQANRPKVGQGYIPPARPYSELRNAREKVKKHGK